MIIDIPFYDTHQMKLPNQACNLIFIINTCMDNTKLIYKMMSKYK